MSPMFNPSGDRQPGFDAVAAKYGEDMVTRIKNWPMIEANVLQAQGLSETYIPHGETEPIEDKTYSAAMEKIRQRVERAKRDKDYALEQAAMIVRAKIPRDQWAVVPTVAQLVREWYPDDEGKAKRHADLGHDTPLSGLFDAYFAQFPQGQKLRGEAR